MLTFFKETEEVKVKGLIVGGVGSALNEVKSAFL